MSNACILLIDRSWSMRTIWSEMIESANSFGRKMAAKGVAVEVILFDKDLDDPNIMQRLPVGHDGWKAIDPEAYKPRGSTPLYDAVGVLGQWLLSTMGQDSKVTLAIVTDGEDTSSGWSSRASRKVMLELKARGWQVIFLGKGEAAFKEGDKVGAEMAQSLFVGEGHGAVMRSMSFAASAAERYHNTGELRAFTDQEREEAK